MRLILCALLLIASVTSVASDWPHWLGPNSNNTVTPEANFNPDLNAWKVLWKAELGKGYSAVAVSGDHAYSLGHDGTANETVYCFDAETGKELWKHTYPAKLMPDLHTGGPNATPTIVGDKVITIGKDGQVFCLSADKGAVVWNANLLEILGVKVPRWGFASSAVIDGTQILLCSGKALAASTWRPASLCGHPQTHYFPQGYTAAPVFELGGAKDSSWRSMGEAVHGLFGQRRHGNHPPPVQGAFRYERDDAGDSRPGQTHLHFKHSPIRNARFRRQGADGRLDQQKNCATP